MPRQALVVLLVWIITLQLGSCGGSANGSQSDPTAEPLSPIAALGEEIFSDPALSASGRLACATCHDPDHAHAAPTTDAVSMGGMNLDEPGFRNAPSLRYIAQTPRFAFDNDGTPSGGFNRDGRAITLVEQARRPFLEPHEMANASVFDVVEKLAVARYAERFRQLFGATIFDQPVVAFERALLAIARYQLEDTAEFAPFSSRYDAFLAGDVVLSDAELRGLALFNSPQKGNCAACHPSARAADGSPPLFTDFSYDNLGVPRNAAIPANTASDYFDLGLCGPFRDELASQRDLCGAFKVPTLRNIAVTAPYFHNGVFATLKETLEFYVRRDTNPDEWYPVDANGEIQKFNDLPAQYRSNVNTVEVPYNRMQGAEPALSDAEIDDLISFLHTLTDGFSR